MSASKPQRYSVWIGKRNTPMESADAKCQMLKDQTFQFEMHTRNWDNGGYIVSGLILYINIFLFLVTPKCFWFFLCATFLISTVQFLSGVQNWWWPQTSMGALAVASGDEVLYAHPPRAHYWNFRQHCASPTNRPCFEAAGSSSRTSSTTSHSRKDWYFPLSLFSFNFQDIFVCQVFFIVIISHFISIHFIKSQYISFHFIIFDPATIFDIFSLSFSFHHQEPSKKRTVFPQHKTQEDREDRVWRI